MSKYSEISNYLESQVDFKPEIGIILGSGLGRLADYVEDAKIVSYKSIHEKFPEFPVSTAPGHKGNFIFGKINGKKVIMMQGRFHYYEGYSMEQVTFPVRIFAKLGVNTLIVTNAAGGVNLNYDAGDIMIIKDHISLSPNPLIGKNLDEFGVRFPDMTVVYDKGLRAMAHDIADEMGIKVSEGVYMNLTGPSYETVSEVKMFRIMGADAVGMSTVPEVVVARHCGIRVFGMSVITNKATSEDGELLDEQEVLVHADQAATKVMAIVNELIRRM